MKMPFFLFEFEKLLIVAIVFSFVHDLEQKRGVPLELKKPKVIKGDKLVSFEYRCEDDEITLRVSWFSFSFLEQALI